MAGLLHIIGSPRGAESQSRQIGDAFVAEYRATHPDDEVEEWDLWDGTLPQFGPDAVNGRLAVFYGNTPEGVEAEAWQAAVDTFRRFDAADRLVFSCPMWNHGLPYIVKQLIDVISQPGLMFGLSPETGYEHLLAGRGKKAVTIYSSAVWAKGVDPRFGTGDFQSTYLADWLRWTGITDIEEVRFQPTLAGDAEAVFADALTAARKAAATF